VCVCVPVCGCVTTIKTKTPDRSDMKLGGVIVLNYMSKPIDLGFSRSRVSVVIRVSERALICISREGTFFLFDLWHVD